MEKTPTAGLAEVIDLRHLVDNHKIQRQANRCPTKQHWLPHVQASDFS